MVPGAPGVYGSRTGPGSFYSRSCKGEHAVSPFAADGLSWTPAGNATLVLRTASSPEVRLLRRAGRR